MQEQCTVVRLGKYRKGVTSVHVAAAPHMSPPSEQRESRIQSSRIGCLLEAQVCTFISRACNGAVMGAPLENDGEFSERSAAEPTEMRDPLCSPAHGCSSVSISEVNSTLSE